MFFIPKFCNVLLGALLRFLRIPSIVNRKVLTPYFKQKKSPLDLQFCHFSFCLICMNDKGLERHFGLVVMVGGVGVIKYIIYLVCVTSATVFPCHRCLKYISPGGDQS